MNDTAPTPEQIIESAQEEISTALLFLLSLRKAFNKAETDEDREDFSLLFMSGVPMLGRLLDDASVRLGGCRFGYFDAD